MENLTGLEIAGIIILVLLFGGVILRIAKRLVGLLIVAVVVILGIYFVKPKLIDEWFGKETRIEMEDRVKRGGEELKPHIKDGLEKVSEALDSAEKKL